MHLFFAWRSPEKTGEEGGTKRKRLPGNTVISILDDDDDDEFLEDFEIPSMICISENFQYFNLRYQLYWKVSSNLRWILRGCWVVFICFCMLCNLNEEFCFFPIATQVALNRSLNSTNSKKVHMILFWVDCALDVFLHFSEIIYITVSQDLQRKSLNLNSTTEAERQVMDASGVIL